MSLLDIHCHGAVGHAFGDTVAGSREAAAHHAQAGADAGYGPTRVIASLVSAGDALLLDQVRHLAPLVAEGTIAGIHLEGPFLSEARRGAHDPRMLRDPDPDVIDRLVAVCAGFGVPQAIRHLTFAPERPRASELITTLAAHGIRPAIGHTDAGADVVTTTISEISEATGAPALVTHLFNGMPPFHHRGGGPVAAALTAAGRGEAIVELIADGVHVAPEVARMVFETVGPQQIALVSDAMAATGLGDGDYRLGSLQVEVLDGVARLADGGSIAGSTATLAEVLRWASEVAGVNAEDALIAASQTPARAVGLEVAA